MLLHLSLPAAVEANVGVALTPAVSPQAWVATAAPASGEGDGDDEDNPSALSGILSLLPLVAIGLAGYFLLIRPARRRQKEQTELSRSVEVGDEVLLTSGVVGFITAKDDDVYWVEIDDDVQVRVVPGAISRKWTPAAPATSTVAAADESTDDLDDEVADLDDAADTELTTPDEISGPAPDRPGAKGRAKPGGAGGTEPTA